MKHTWIVFVVCLVVGCASRPDVPETADAEELAGIYTEMGLAYLKRGQYERARGRLEKALALVPDSAAALHYVAEVYSRLGEPENAEANFRKALQLTPADPNLQNNFAVFLCAHNKLEEADQFFNKAMINPEYVSPYVAAENAGRCALKSGDKITAERYFRKALKEQPKTASALYHMAVIQFDKKEFFKARAYIERYQEVGPQTAEMLWLGIQIEKELGDSQMVANYSELLKQGFRNSPEAEKLYHMEKEALKDDDNEENSLETSQ